VPGEFPDRDLLAFGKHPQHSAVSSAQQLNMVDGPVNPVFAVQEMSFHEVTTAGVQRPADGDYPAFGCRKTRYGSGDSKTVTNS
jgi:hypothetical protein